MVIHIHEAVTATTGDSTVAQRFEQLETAVNRIATVCNGLLKQLEVVVNQVEALETNRLVDPEPPSKASSSGVVLPPG